jgi:hypothetical protein
MPLQQRYCTAWPHATMGVVFLLLQDYPGMFTARRKTSHHYINHSCPGTIISSLRSRRSPGSSQWMAIGVTGDGNYTSALVGMVSGRRTACVQPVLAAVSRHRQIVRLLPGAWITHTGTWTHAYQAGGALAAEHPAQQWSPQPPRPRTVLASHRQQE